MSADSGGPGGKAVKPSEERKSEKSERSSEMQWGVERRVALRPEEEGAEEARLILGEPGEARKNTLWLATSRKRQWWQRKSTPRMGRDTKAS